MTGRASLKNLEGKMSWFAGGHKQMRNYFCEV